MRVDSDPVSEPTPMTELELARMLVTEVVEHQVTEVSVERTIFHVEGLLRGWRGSAQLSASRAAYREAAEWHDEQAELARKRGENLDPGRTGRYVQANLEIAHKDSAKILRARARSLDEPGEPG
jgi:hypothetical protein